MLELINDVKIKDITIPTDIKQAFFKKKLIFNTTVPECIFLATYYVLDFDKEILIEINYQNDHNVNLLNQYDPTLINVPCHSVIPYSDGFCSFATNTPTDCFRYVDLNNYQTIVYTKDDFPITGLVHLKSAGYHNLNNENMILAFSTEDKETIIIEYERNFTVSLLAKIDRDDIFIHDIIYKDQTLLLSNFEFFKVIDDENNVVTKDFSDFKSLVANGYIPGKDKKYKQNLGELFVIDTTNNEYYIQNTLIGSTAHFILGKENDIYLSMHNLTSIDFIHYHYAGPAAISKWSLDNNVLEHVSDFTDETFYRAPQPLLSSNNFLYTFSHPNRIYCIDAETMEVSFVHDLDEPYNLDLINTVDNLSLQEKYCYNDINISPNGKYVCIFSYDNIQIFNTENKTIDVKIEFPRDPSSLIHDYFRRITHTCLI